MRIPKRGSFNVMLGKWLCGGEWLQCNVRNDDGGEFYNLPCGMVVVGLDQENWDDCLCTLLHEVMEFVISRLGGRFLPTRSVSHGHDGYVFIFDHPLFSEIIACTAQFAANAIPELAKVYKQRRDGRK